MTETERLADFQMLRTRGFSLEMAVALVLLRGKYLRGKFNPPEGLEIPVNPEQ